MSIFRRQRFEAMPARFNELAAYNTRKSQGVLHEPEYVARMAALQEDFNNWRDEANEREFPGIVRHPWPPASSTEGER